jgi:hypothetical protein
MRTLITSLAIAALVAIPAVSLAGEQQDKAAAEQIATILRDSGQMQNYSVGVKYKSGTVWLSGKVANDQQMQTALDVVGDIEGVRQIVNNMAVGSKPGAKGSAKGSKNVRASAIEPATAKSSSMKRAASTDGDVAPAGYHHLPGHRAARVVGPSAAVLAPVGGQGVQPAAYDQPHMPNYAWPSYAASPNYAAVTYPKQYSATAWPFIGPFYPYPQVPLGWRKVSLEWDDGWWFLDFQDRNHH